MPRPTKKISSFDVCLGAVVRSKRAKLGMTQEALSSSTGIPMSNLKRREDGRNEITVSELYRIAAAVKVPAVSLVEEALDDYGGMDKLIDEHVSKPANNVVELNVRGSRDIDLTKVPLHNIPLAASTDNTPIDPSRGEA
ncbi:MULTISPECIES: helix-turn-helix domain-containing protein [unclassified Microbacterium]|uniref:helix-turn-helix domain-containing protein n=1 Tax=unclassified Microbacterium TaxID=2609290 RepID=UPI00301A4D55